MHFFSKLLSYPLEFVVDDLESSGSGSLKRPRVGPAALAEGLGREGAEDAVDARHRAGTILDQDHSGKKEKKRW